MKIFLTSKIGSNIKVDGARIPTHIYTDNNLHQMLKAHWKFPAKVLVVASDPDEAEINESVRSIFEQSFALSGLDTACVHLCDGRNPEIVCQIADYDVVILAGGHVPTQNRFFHSISLKEYLRKFDGILVGISAGTMNCADVVYAAPEADGESIDANYQRFLPGLGVTNLNIFPHYQKVKDEILDGRRVMEDITYPDSIGRTFYALVDGSFIHQENGKQTLYGEAYRISNGAIEKICKLDQFIEL